jgi:hypothetical protein
MMSEEARVARLLQQQIDDFLKSKKRERSSFFSSCMAPAT